MESDRLIYRNRTRERIAKMLTYPLSEQMRFFGFETKKQLDDKLVRVEKGLANDNLDYCIFDLIEKESNIVVGSCGFHKWVKEHARTEIGYEIHAKYQNKGYMSEAMKVVLAYGFNEMELHRIEALIGPNNAASIRIVEKYNFIREGILSEHYKIGDVFEDSILYALLKSDFKI